MTENTYKTVSLILLSFTLLAGIATVVVYFFQLKVMRETLDRMILTLHSQVSADLTTQLNAYNQVEINHPEIHDFYNSVYLKWDEKSHVGSLVTDMRFTVYEEAFSQYERGLMDASSWRIWEKIIARWLGRPFFPGYWKIARPYFNESFAKVVDELLKSAGNSNNAEQSGEREPPKWTFKCST
jgi:hypothetical protein